jgi:hypothetical protein
MTGTKPMRVALYARVSTTNHGQDVIVQKRELGTTESVSCFPRVFRGRRPLVRFPLTRSLADC